jgi:hypothetical protein
MPKQNEHKKKNANKERTRPRLSRDAKKTQYVPLDRDMFITHCLYRPSPRGGIAEAEVVNTSSAPSVAQSAPDGPPLSGNLSDLVSGGLLDEGYNADQDEEMADHCEFSNAGMDEQLSWDGGSAGLHMDNGLPFSLNSRMECLNGKRVQQLLVVPTHSSVIIYTRGNCPVKFIFKYPDSKKGVMQKTKYYVTSPSFQMKMGDGWITVIDRIDDMLMLHTLVFDNDEGREDEYRIAWVYRYLGVVRDFYVSTCTVRRDAEMKSCKSMKDIGRLVKTEQRISIFCKRR